MKKKEGMFVSPPEFVLYYNPSCPACKAVMPEWNAVQDAHRNGCVKVYSVDVTQNPYFAEQKRTVVSKVPTIMLYPYGDYNSMEEYDGYRSAANINQWLNRRIANLRVC